MCLVVMGIVKILKGLYSSSIQLVLRHGCNCNGFRYVSVKGIVMSWLLFFMVIAMNCLFL